jgi:alkane 1-monooxygenase
MRLGGPWAFLPIALVLVFLPLADWVAGLNLAGPTGEEDELERNPWFRAITWLWVPVHVALLVWCLDRAGSGALSGWETAGLLLSMGLVAGAVGITFAHELVHRSGRFERALGEVLLSMTSYAHFAIEHVHGHHRFVGTPRDAATARAGESVYHFIPRSVIGGVRSAWRFEVERLARRHRGALHPSNRMLRYGATQIAIVALAAAGWGPAAAVFFGAQSTIAFSLLETINYIEHYGLYRREIEPGRYERVMPWHSWNSSHRLSNWLLINLARHADHHLVASKRYQLLEHAGEAPQLPAGYGAMLLAALCPPVWRMLMDPRVERWRKTYAEPTA